MLGKMGIWHGKFLDPSTRKQAVAADCRLSDLSPVISGVLQWKVIGPILFLLHISSIAREVSADTHTIKILKAEYFSNHLLDHT